MEELYDILPYDPAKGWLDFWWVIWNRQDDSAFCLNKTYYAHIPLDLQGFVIRTLGARGDITLLSIHSHNFLGDVGSYAIICPWKRSIVANLFLRNLESIATSTPKGIVWVSGNPRLFQGNKVGERLLAKYIILHKSRTTGMFKKSHQRKTYWCMMSSI